MNRLGRAYGVIVYGCTMLGMAALAACSGAAFSVGTNASTTEAIASSAAATVGPSCDSASAHPNVCCNGTDCVVYKTPSLQSCPSDHQVTRPDSRYCCPLDGSGACAPTSGSPATSGAGSSCMYPCLPGYTLSQTLSDPSTNQCCNGSACYTVASPDCSEPVCTCAGQANCTCAAAPACALPSPLSCNACPSGWQVPSIDPALCCRNDPAVPTMTDCFSQAIPLPPPGDAGTVPPQGDAGTPVPCLDNGQSHADGTTWKCSDGCNDCACQNGQISSTLLACPVDAGSPPPANDAGPSPCVDNGVSHANGTSWTCSNDACGGCFCENGAIGHTTIACALDGGSGSADAAPPPPVDAAECAVATDCKGALPQVCQLCTNGSNGCAHFACNAGVCEIVTCQ